ncbi:hypothetical protein IDH44_14395 [Paenibacillus sp. IB182496]|uniref:SGNH hydrolase-type esterase domain-containing protein n=1 Tax=Paenibacillus sabuli TaxID=2772509 RepID=A0A927GSU1_9BACL|nr:SGNH/GDSL hydrolase family protein [Paenibacillus sabuli]MBD2846390.1 hypothetical protein [Paenibacillus sabuli]
MTLQIHHHRTPLARTFERLAAGHLRIGLLGGSITAPAPHNWSEPVVAWLMNAYPAAQIVVENAAIGSTGSELARFRAQRDIVERDCDLIILEYAVNDHAEPAEKRLRTREGLIRHLLRTTDADIVCVYTFRQEMHADMMAERMPPSVAEFEQLAAHYQLGSVWMGLHALREVKQGWMSWEGWLPDGLHPRERGSWSYAQSVTAFLEAERARLPAPAPAGAGEGGARAASRDAAPAAPGRSEGGVDCAPARLLPPPVSPGNWERVRTVDFADMACTGPWSIRRRRDIASLDQALFSSSPGARLAFSFTGRGVTLASIFGQYAAEYRYRIDGGAWMDSARDRSVWCPEKGYPRMDLATDELPPGEHRFELELVHGVGPNCKGTHFELLFAGIIE